MSPDPGFLKAGYHKKTASGQKVVRDDLMTTHARTYGELFASRDRNVQVSSSQLRAFFGDVKALENKIEMGGPESFDKFYYLVKMLKSKASYAQGKRSGGRVSKDFRDYIHTCIEAVHDLDDFRAFLKFFESTVGFYYGAGGERIA